MRTLLTVLAVLAFAAPRAEAQCTGTPGTDFQIVTARQINDIPQTNVDALVANAASLTPTQISTNLTANPLVNQQVQFTAVVLSDPYNSGLASINATTGIPNRVHVFVRDVTAATAGNAGMGLQIVDGRGDGQVLTLLPGDEIVVCGLVAPFPNAATGAVAMQINPSSLTPTGTSYDPSSPLRQPVTVTTADVHNTVNGLTQIDWARYEEFNGQFVRFEDITVVQGVAGPRPDVLFQSTGATEQINLYDTSLRFRNDRDGVYPNPPYNTRPASDPFVPPVTGIVDLQGFLIYQGDNGTFNYSTPTSANFVVNPMDDSDFVIATSPPVVAVAPLAAAPSSSAPVTITATIAPGTAGATISTAVINYLLPNGTSGTATMGNTGGDTYTGQIPAAGVNGGFVTFTVSATDSQGAQFTTPTRSYRALDGPITSIDLVQRTFNSDIGPSPFYFGTNNNPGPAVPFNLDATVQALFQGGTSWYGILQDDDTLQPWTGVWAFFGSTQPALSVGDRITITEAAINERFDVTQLQNIVFSVTGTGTPIADKTVTTDLFQGTTGRATAEAHEGMMLRFDNVTITDPNADGPDEPGTTPNFVEWAFTNAGPANPFRMDGFTPDFPATWNQDNLAIGQVRSYHRGAMYFSFTNWKLVATSTADAGTVTSSSEPTAEAGTARLVGAFPNPADATARVRFELDAPSDARVSLFDALGREVAVLASGARAAGLHDVDLDARGLAAGVYVLRLVADDAVATMRLSVAR